MTWKYTVILKPWFAQGLDIALLQIGGSSFGEIEPKLFTFTWFSNVVYHPQYLAKNNDWFYAW